MSTEYFQKLLTPINIGKMEVKNRIAMAGMATGFFSREGFVTEQAKNYYEARAKGGVGMIIVEATCVDVPRGFSLYRPAIDSDVTITGLSELVRVIKKHGAKAILQLYHAGRIARPKITGFPAVAPSPIPSPTAGVVKPTPPKELTIAEISDIVKLFAEAAVRGKKAGFDGIEIHAVHGYLLAQFLAPHSNQRQDKYGGDAQNRAQLLLEVLKAIRQYLGDDYPLWCRITGQESGIDNPLTINDAMTTVRTVDSLVDAIHVSAWGWGRGPASLAYLPSKPGEILPLASKIRSVTSKPVLAVGRLNPELGEQAINEGKADIIVLGRALIADPDLPNKALNGNLEDIRPCIACFHCSDITESPGITRITCAVNPAVGKESEYTIPTKTIRRIAVIGGGPAGMEAARLLAMRGHKVTIFEKEDHLGGQMHLAIVPPNKKELIQPFTNYLITQINKLKINVKLNTEANVNILNKYKPDFIVLATGSRPIIPEIPGANLDNVFTAHDILSGKPRVGKRVIIIGGGSTGLETAEFLSCQGKEVTVVEMLNDLAIDMGPRDKLRLLSRINALPIKCLTGSKCIAIQKDGILLENKENIQQSIKADAVVLAVGVIQNNALYLQLKAKGFETRVIGDAWHIGRIVGAISEAFGLGCSI